MPYLIAVLQVSFAKIAPFFLPGPINDRFHTADVQRDTAIPSLALLTLLVSSPCLNTNEEIDL